MTESGRTGWTAPDAQRVDPPRVAGERAALEGWLDYHRATLLQKCSGLTADQLRRPAVPPSTMTLLGLVRHLADVERAWFRRRLAGEDAPYVFQRADNLDADFDDVDTADAGADLETYRSEVAAARSAIAGRSLADTFVRERDGEEFLLDLRWVMVHMIEEYARHNGHADLLRQCIDGATGA